ncbi:MAG: hypothetical protein Kow00121_55020 [Elainellaceae cyanobacterium]
MSYIILERTYDEPLPVPLSHTAWDNFNDQFDRCLEMREIHWVQSLISRDGRRSLCLFEAPYADAVREACRESRAPFDQVWRAEIWMGTLVNPKLVCDSVIAAEATYRFPMTKELWDQGVQRARACAIELEVQRLFTLMSAKRQQSICLFNAASAETVRSFYRRVGIPFDLVWRADVLAAQ